MYRPTLVTFYQTSFTVRFAETHFTSCVVAVYHTHAVKLIAVATTYGET